MKKNILTIFLVCISMMFLVGWGENKIELLDNNKLIDLDKAIEYAKPGGEINDDGSRDTDGADVSDDPQPYSEEPARAEEPVVKTIRIRGEVITFEDYPVGKETIAQRVQDANKAGITFRLVDDWAESQTYKYVKNLMEELHASDGLIFLEE